MGGYTYNWGLGVYLDAKGNEVSWQTAVGWAVNSSENVASYRVDKNTSNDTRSLQKMVAKNKAGGIAGLMNYWDPDLGWVSDYEVTVHGYKYVSVESSSILAFASAANSILGISATYGEVVNSLKASLEWEKNFTAKVMKCYMIDEERLISTLVNPKTTKLINISKTISRNSFFVGTTLGVLDTGIKLSQGSDPTTTLTRFGIDTTAGALGVWGGPFGAVISITWFALTTPDAIWQAVDPVSYRQSYDSWKDPHNYNTIVVP